MKYTPAPQVKAWLKDTLTDAAIDRRDSGMFRKFYLGATQSDGSPVDNSDAAQAHARNLDREVQEQQLRERVMQNQSNEIFDANAKRDGRIAIADMLADKRKTNPTATFANLDPNDLMSKLPPSVRADVATSLASAATAQQGLTNIQDEQGRRDLFNRKLGDYMNGKLGADGDKAFITALALLNGTGDGWILARPSSRTVLRD